MRVRKLVPLSGTVYLIWFQESAFFYIFESTFSWLSIRGLTQNEIRIKLDTQTENKNVQTKKMPFVTLTYLENKTKNLPRNFSNERSSD